MKKNLCRIVLAVIALMVFGGMTAFAQNKTRHQNADQTASAQTGKKGQEWLHNGILKVDMSAMMNEPHHVLTMAFLQNVQTFAKALNEQAQGGNQLSADFARAAVSEISRSFDEARSHHQEHVKTMSPGSPSRMSGMGDMDMRDSKLKEAIRTLEKDVENYTLSSKQIAADCADVLKHLDEMLKMHNQE